MEGRGRSRARRLTGYKHWKRALAFTLAAVLVVLHGSSNLWSVFSETPEEVVFEMQGEDLTNAVETAILEGTPVTENDLSFTNGKTEPFEQLFFGEEKVYEVYPEIEGQEIDKELRVFVRVPADADDMYMVTGDEDIVFLYINNSDQVVSFLSKIYRTEGDTEKCKTTKRITVKSFETSFGDEEIEINSDPVETATPSEAERIEETLPVQESTEAAVEVPEETIETEAEETSEVIIVDETENLQESEQETSLDPEAERSLQTAPVVGDQEQTEEAAEESTEAAEESTEAVEESTEAVEESTEAVEESTEAVEESTEAVEESTEAAEETTEAVEESTEAVEETTEAAEESTEALPDPLPEATGSEASTDSNADKDENLPGSSDIAGLDYCGTVKAYITSLNRLKAMDDYEGYKVSYSIEPQNMARIVDGPRGVAEGENLTFGIKSRIGYGINTVTANGETLTAEYETTDETGASISWFTAPEIAEEQNVAVSLTEQGITYTYEDDTVLAEVTLAPGTQVPAGAQLVVTPIRQEDEQFQTLYIQAQEQTGNRVAELVLYDIGFTVDGQHYDVTEDASVSLTLKDSSIQADPEDQVSVIHFSNEGIQTPEVTSVEKDENQQVKEISFDTTGFSPFGVSALTAKSMQLYEIADVDDVSSGTYIIVNAQDNNYVLTDQSDDSGHLLGTSVRMSALSGGAVWIESDEELCQWKISKKGNGNEYYIKSENKGYLKIANSGLSFSRTQQTVNLEVDDSFPNRIRITSDSNDLNRYGNQSYFGSFAGGSSDPNSHQLLLKVSSETGAKLGYDLNIPVDIREDHYGRGGDWYTIENGVNQKTEVGVDVVQNITSAPAPLNQVSGSYKQDSETGNSIYMFLRGKGSMDTPGADIPTISDALKNYNEPIGKQYEFEGWTYTDSNGQEHLIKTDAQVSASGNELLITQGDESIQIPVNTVLKGKWSHVSDTVLFFVNYTGTILDTEYNIEGRDVNNFTGVVGIGTVYYTDESQAGNDGVFAKEINEKIRERFSGKTEVHNGTPGLVVHMIADVEGGTVGSGRFSHDPEGFTDQELDEAVLEYLQSKNQTIQIVNQEGILITLNTENVDSSNYEVRWYVLKQQEDAWHVDGVLVAKTAELTVTKTFEGLTDDEIERVKKNFSIDVYLGNNSKPYISLKNSDSPISGAYTWEYDPVNHKTTWKVRVLPGEKYTLKEEGYSVSNKDCVTAVVIDNDTENVKYTNEQVADLTEVSNRTIDFRNAYLADGTLSIKKIDAYTDRPLSGVSFQLTGTGGYEENLITDANGIATFTGLQNGSYILKEVKAPAGYSEKTEAWTVKVDQYRGKYTVTINDVICCQFNSQTNSYQIIPYEIKNTPAADTLIIKKQFASAEQSGLQGLPADYQITVGETVLTLANANAVSSDQHTYTWYIPDVEEGIKYKITESGYSLDAYKVTTVEAYQGEENGAEPLDVMFEDGSASVKITKAPGTAHITFTNTYSNEYGLQVKKIDGESKKPLSGAEFELYGPFAETEDQGKKYQYEGNTYYYIGAVGPTGEDGMAETPLSGLKYDSVYLLVETKSPDGYNKNTEPIVINLSENEDPNQILINGICTVAVENTAGMILPETGSIGDNTYVMPGILLAFGAGLFGITNARRKRG